MMDTENNPPPSAAAKDQPSEGGNLSDLDEGAERMESSGRPASEVEEAT